MCDPIRLCQALAAASNTLSVLTRVGGGRVHFDALLLQGLQALGQQGDAVAGHAAGWGVSGRRLGGGAAREGGTNEK